MKAIDLNLREQLVFDPEHGRVTFGGNRRVLVATEMMGTLVDALIEVGDVVMAKVLLRRCGDAAGHRLAQVFRDKFHPENQHEWFTLGPTMHAWEGVGKPSLAVFEYDPERAHFLLEVHVEDSYLAEQYVVTQGPATEPVCWLLAGYIGGYCAEVFGLDLVCYETSCKAQGEPYCTFVVKPREAWLT